jgi:hypothetical protein
MTLSPTNEAIRREHHDKKKLNKKEKNTAMIWVFMQDVRIVILSKKCKIL